MTTRLVAKTEKGVLDFSGVRLEDLSRMKKARLLERIPTVMEMTEVVTERFFSTQVMLVGVASFQPVRSALSLADIVRVVKSGREIFCFSHFTRSIWHKCRNHQYCAKMSNNSMQLRHVRQMEQQTTAADLQSMTEM